MTDLAFSLLFKADSLGPNPKRIHIEANTDECNALAKDFDLQGITSLKGQCMMQRLGGKKIQCEFTAQSTIIQECVVTHKPVKNRIELEFERIFDEIKDEEDQKEIEIDIDASDELDPIIDGMIDLGAAISEELALAIDPFPRADGSEFEDFGIGPEITEEEVKSSSPFAVLANLKKKND